MGSPETWLAPWLGARCTSVIAAEHDWSFGFGQAGGVVLSCPWRIVTPDGIALGHLDHGQLFGLRKPLDGEATARKLLAGEVSNVRLGRPSGDLLIDFGRVTLEVFNNSAGYEGWVAGVCGPNDNYQVIAMGGGDLARA